MTIEDINRQDQAQFVDALGWLFEHSPWVAERAWRHHPFECRDELCDRMNGEVEAASLDERLALIRAHPDLGTRAKMSPSSASEQAGAGLDQLTQAEYDRLVKLNTAYLEKFGFPFIYAVKGSNKFAILEALWVRLEANYEEEMREALRQVYQIARFRLEDIVR
jgi:OHCU decarboxylase